MGLDVNSIRYHCWLKKKGVSFQHVATLGRQYIYGLDPKSLARAISHSGLEISVQDAAAILKTDNGYAESFYKWLGAETVDSFDYSSYEEATHIWDMNDAVADEFRELYDFVFDGGTLEHVFQYASALRESITLVKKGGVFLSATPANSYLGHGLYQLGPDLAFAVLQGKNGYTLGGVDLIEMRNRASFYEVIPPFESRGRTLASTFWPTMMYFWGTRSTDVPAKLEVFQPDYEAAWSNLVHMERSRSLTYRTLKSMFNFLPVDVRNDSFRLAKLCYTILSRNGLFDKRHFREQKNI